MNQLAEALAYLILAALFTFFAGYQGYLAFSDNVGHSRDFWYAINFGVRVRDVQTDAKPNDCDFMHAPIGYKGCSYTAYVEFFDADGELLVGSGKESYKWWLRGTVHKQPKKPKSVRVSWVKEEHLVVATSTPKKPVAMKQDIPTCAKYYANRSQLFGPDNDGLKFCQESAMQNVATPGKCRAIWQDGLGFDMCERTAAELRHAGEPDWQPTCADIFADDSSRRKACEYVEGTTR